MNTSFTPQDQRGKSTSEGQKSFSAPSISLPKGGGAIRGIGEKFAANPVTGTGSMSVPIATSPGRSGFGPQLSLAYDSGSGNGPFGFGWSLSLPAITRKTDKGLPQYFDGGKNKPDSDVYILSGAEDLVPVYQQDDEGNWIHDAKGNPMFHEDERDGYLIRRYRPRIEGLFARIERWTNQTTGEIHWRSITRDNITTLYGKDNRSRIFDPSELDATGPVDLEKARPKRIFSWLISESYDDMGNTIVYQYSEENSYSVDLAATHEKNRTANSRMANRYLKRVLYGNRVANRDAKWEATDSSQLTDWMFEVVFDYGHENYDSLDSEVDDQQFVAASLEPSLSPHWPVRQDPFSSYRSTFEVRTYRLCRRVLMFHHFPAELGIKEYLVRSTEFSYSESPIASFITSVTQSGYVRRPIQEQPNRYLKKSLPPLEFEYSQVPGPERLARQPIREVDPKSLENLPVGLDGASYQWMDLDGEGTSGILTEQADGWYYKRNLSANHQVTENGHESALARFGATEVVARKPSSGLNGGAQFLDLAGDGQVDLVQMEGSLRGFYERTDDPNWSPFQAFASWPEVDTRDPHLKFVDLTGDGHADILMTEGDKLSWYPSLAEEGFGPAVRVNLPSDEEKGPRLVFADGTQSVYLADLSGDGLSDLVRIRNGEISYWPNLGYGHFGAKVTMNNAPWFDSPDQFDQKRIRLADTDGSGTTDIFYLRRDGVQIYFNQCGNRWSEAVTLPQFPPIENISAVQVLDLLGNGTACLVWSSPLPGNNRRPMRYLALMEEKPHLLIGVKNNLGAETRVHYAPSTKFYLNDKQAGKPWITRLPFPVHVVERAETSDWISRNRFVTRYDYHHGYFDGPEREFRGFGMVEQWDTEEIGTLTLSTANDTNWEDASFVPPVITRTWFHTGAFLDERRISKQYEADYYREGDTSKQLGGLTETELRAQSVDDTTLPTTIRKANGNRDTYQLTADEVRQACRSLKGAILRQEIFALDKNSDGTPTDESDRPYSVSERNYTIELLQPQEHNRHAVFFTHARETVDFHYERKLFDIGAGKQRADPRVTHALTLDVDNFGNVLQSVAIGYGRRFPDSLLTTQDQKKQTDMLVTYTENVYTNAVLETNAYHTPLLCESRSYEVLHLKLDPSKILPGTTNLFSFDEVVRQIKQAGDGSRDLPYEDINHTQATTSDPYRRLIEHVRTLYRKNDLTGFSPLGTVESLALPGESYQLALTPALLNAVYGGRVTDQMLSVEGRYVHSEGDVNWWIPAGRAFYSPIPNDLPASELTFARDHFFLPHRYRDPFDNETTIAYDSHNLLLVETIDALGNVVTVNTQDDDGNIAICNDYRVLQPDWVTDPNNNRTKVTFDALGMVIATAVMGKPGKNQGDNLIDLEADLTQGELDAVHDSNDPHALAPTLLKSASARILYDLDRFYHSQKAHPTDSTQWEPSYAVTFARETHASDPLPAHGLKIQISFSYSDGFGREIQKKIQAEPGEVEVEDATGTNITVVDTTPNLRWVGSGWTIYNNKGKPVRQYEPFFSTHHHFQYGKKTGVSPVLFYDPVERLVATLHPNQTWEKVVLDPWQQITYDANDTVTFDPQTDPDVGPFFSRLTDEEYTVSWYQQRINGAMGAAEESAAEKAAGHADTPIVTYFDTLGRTYLTVAHNKFKQNDVLIEEKYPTRIVYDLEGNQREVIDAKDRIVMRYDYDMLGNRVHQASMEAGEHWMLNDVTGEPIRGWDSRGFIREMTYDALHRPIELFVTVEGNRWLAEQTEYGESQGDAENHRTRVFKVFDGAGVVTSERYDFKGNILESRRDLLSDYQHAADWTKSPSPDGGTFSSFMEYDALDRPLSVTTPDGSIYKPTFNEANLLNSVDVNLRGAGVATHFVTDIDYNAKGQRTLIAYGSGNGTTTTYHYDPLTYRLIQLTTARPANPDGLASQLFVSPAIIQDLHYTYDPVGNITNILDKALPILQYDGQSVEPNADYVYDAIYRLIFAHGREHVGQSAFDFDSLDGSFRDYPFVGLRASPNDPKAMRNFTESYRYDKAGNIERVRHSAAKGSWTRSYVYNEDSLIEGPAKKSNRLTQTTIGNGIDFPETYTYEDLQGSDVHGCMTSINSMHMTWDFEEQLQKVELGGGATAFYIYDAAGQRVRKVIQRQNGTKQKERFYLGGFEIYREYNGATEKPNLERETLHIMDDNQRIALVETKTIDISVPSSVLPETLTRYQFSNHLGSASQELDEQAQLISYEEYYPYGATSYQAVRSQTEMPKRYRFTGQERDPETGFTYQGVRYYAPWLGRWISTDPGELIDGTNTFGYVGNSPIQLVDSTGLAGESPDPKDVAEFETRQAAFEAGKDLEQGKIHATKKGKKLPPPKGKQLEKLAGESKKAKELRLKYGTKQGKEAEKYLLKNVKERSAAAARGEKGGHFGEGSQKLVPEVGFHKGKITSVGKAPGGQPKGARTADLAIAKKATPPSKYDTLKGKKGSGPLKEALDLKLGGGKVKDKPGFKKQSGGLGVREITPGVTSRAEATPRVPSRSGQTGAARVGSVGGTALAGTAFVLVYDDLRRANTPEERRQILHNLAVSGTIDNATYWTLMRVFGAGVATMVTAPLMLCGDDPRSCQPATESAAPQVLDIPSSPPPTSVAPAEGTW